MAESFYEFCQQGPTKMFEWVLYAKLEGTKNQSNKKSVQINKDNNVQYK